jgi:hypothetical protein
MTQVKASPWNSVDKKHWLSQQKVQRSYQQQVVAPLKACAKQLEQDGFSLVSHGELDYSHLEADSLDKSHGRYPLFHVKTKNWQANKINVLVTGGVHGYETSGVQGALGFIENKMGEYKAHCNFLVIPCVSPWGYETINRWNPEAIDPNRSFYADSPAQESAALMQLVGSLVNDLSIAKFDMHIDLHETTDTDNSVFRPALAARDGIEQSVWNIPDGFYAVGDSEQPVEPFQQAIIERVETVTHIAKADNDGKLIGVSISQNGVINYPLKKLSLCTGFSDAPYNCTTEVYPDSTKADDETCNLAQIAAICGGIEYLIEQK